MPQHPLLIVTPIPADLRSALAERYALVDFDAAKEQAWRCFDVAITTGIVGAGERQFDACPDLKLLVSMGVGLDQIDLAAARRRGIAVAHTPDELAEDVGDGAIAMIYAAMRAVPYADRFVRAGRWGKERIAPSRRVAGKTLGVVGLGRIGLHVARHHVHRRRRLDVFLLDAHVQVSEAARRHDHAAVERGRRPVVGLDRAPLRTPRKEEWRRVFSGWVFRERPERNVVQHPVYDVWVRSCAMKWPDTGPDTVKVGDRSGANAEAASGPGPADNSADSSASEMPDSATSNSAR